MRVFFMIIIFYSYSIWHIYLSSSQIICFMTPHLFKKIYILLSRDVKILTNVFYNNSI